jgi:hypothetical protein
VSLQVFASVANDATNEPKNSKTKREKQQNKTKRVNHHPIVACRRRARNSTVASALTNVTNEPKTAKRNE